MCCWEYNIQSWTGKCEHYTYFLPTFHLSAIMLLLHGCQGTETASFAEEFTSGHQIKALNESTFKELLPRVDKTIPILLEKGITLGRYQWRSQTRAHTGLGPGVSNAKVLRRRVCTATRLCIVALRQYCQCAPDCSTPRSQTLSCLGTRTTLVQSHSQALVCGGECMHIVRCMWGEYFIDPRTSVQSMKVPREPIPITEKWRRKIFSALRVDW